MNIAASDTTMKVYNQISQFFSHSFKMLIDTIWPIDAMRIKFAASVEALRANAGYYCLFLSATYQPVIDF